MRETVRLFSVMALLALWLGGLTFYAAVVVPIANRIVGTDQQGLVTQQATNYLNWIGVGAIGWLLANALLVRSPPLFATAMILGLTQAGLFVIHSQLDQMLAPPAADLGGFY